LSFSAEITVLSCDLDVDIHCRQAYKPVKLISTKFHPIKTGDNKSLKFPVWFFWHKSKQFVVAGVACGQLTERLSKIYVALGFYPSASDAAIVMNTSLGLVCASMFYW